MCTIHLVDEINISSAAKLKTVLLEALSSGREIGLDLERATELDVTALQLFWAADREARNSGKEFRIAGHLPEKFATAASDAGFEKFPVGLK